jgi:hypothetical protein
MGSRGPVPKRLEHRRSHRSKAELATVNRAPGAVHVDQPAADESWHPMARDWYASLATSAGARWYQPSDWQTARVWAELLSRQLTSGRPSAQFMSAWSGAATELLTTTGARGRVLIGPAL